MNFQNYGLSYYESKALNRIIRGKVSIKQLSKEANVPSGKVYSVVKRLLERGIIKISNDRPKYAYVENASLVIKKLIEEKQLRDEEEKNRLMFEISQISSTAQEKNMLFDIGITLEDNLRIQSRVFTEAKKEVCQIFNETHKPKINRTQKSSWEKEINNAILRGVKFKAIYPKGVVLPEILKNIPKDKFQIKYANTNFYRIDIIDDSKVMIKLTYTDPLLFGGILYIENKKLANNIKKIFEDIWNSN